MDKVSKTVDGVRAVFPVYTEKEALAKGYEVKPWKECRKGDFGRSDDGWVSECLYRRSYSKGKKEYLNFPMGVGWVTKTSKIEYEVNKTYGNFGQLNPASTWQEREAGKERSKRAIKAYVSQLLSTEAIDWNKIGRIYRKDQKTPAATVRRLFKEEKFKKMIDKKIEEVLVKKGITKEMVCDINLDALQIAKAKGDASIMHRIGGTFAEWLGMSGGKKVVTDRLEMDMTSQIEETIGKETAKRRVAIERKTEIPESE
jgi:hypothetical protein